MKLLIVRHGDPDYSRDTLTEKGWREAQCLAERLAKLDVKAFYVSPLGRARDTASCTLKRMNRRAVEKEWLREFKAEIYRPDMGEDKTYIWDWLPQDWLAEERYLDVDRWCDTEVMQAGKVREEYEWVIAGFDELLAEHGYRRDGRFYRAERPNNDTLVFFCHFGLGCLLISHLLNISPMPLWHGCCAAPTGVTTVNTEERIEGIASFRMSSFGDISHLYAKGEEPSFAARFCECYQNKDQRHDCIGYYQHSAGKSL